MSSTGRTPFCPDEREYEMSKFLIRGNYVGDGIAGLRKEGGTKRVEAAQAALASVGATLESMYFAFGDTDIFAVIDCPDDATAVAASLLVNESGAVAVSMTPLLTAADMDAAADISGSYAAPGT
jgi:uncharacterized protein with GYD domain